jgi:hypothetical protein
VNAASGVYVNALAGSLITPTLRRATFSPVSRKEGKKSFLVSQPLPLSLK